MSDSVTGCDVWCVCVCVACALQAGGVPRCPGEGSDGGDGGAEEPHQSAGEGGELPPGGAGSPEGGQRPLPQQHHEEPGGTAEGTARPEGEAAQGSPPLCPPHPPSWAFSGVCCQMQRNTCSCDALSNYKSAHKHF